MPIYTFNSRDEYWHDKNSYKEIGELHSNKDYAIVGKIASRYSANKKKSTISPDSDRILYNYFSNPEVKDYAKIEETELRDEKQVFVGSYFLAIYDSKTGNFVCENPKSFLKNLVKPISEGGLGYKTGQNDEYLDLDADDFDSVCANMRYAITEGEYVYVISKINDGRNVMFRVNPYTYEVSSYHADGFLIDIGSKMIYCKPFTISSNIYFLLYNPKTDAIECYCIDTYGSSATSIYGYSSATVEEDGISSVPKTIVKGIKDMLTVNTKIEGSIIALSDEKVNNGTVFFFSANSEPSKATKVYNSSTGQMSTEVSVENWPNINATTTGEYFVEYELFNDKTNNTATNSSNSVNDNDESTTNAGMYIMLLTNKGKMICRAASTTTIYGCVFNVTNGKAIGFYRSVMKAPNAIGYEYFANIICEDSSTGKKYIVPNPGNTINNKTSVTINLSLYASKKNAILETYSEKLHINRNIFNPNGSNLVIGWYEENGKKRPLIKDVGNDYGLFPESDYVNGVNYSDKATAEKTFRKGLEAENGVSTVKNVSFGNTQITRVRLTPEAAAEENPIIQFEDSEIFMREGFTNTNDFTDGKFTTGSFLWKMFAKTGMPYNTHVQSVGRIIIDGKDIPVENVMISPPEKNLDYGNTLLTIDKLFDTNVVTKEFTKNGKALYPGILFQAGSGFLNDAVISNVYNVDRSFAYNDVYRGKLLEDSSDVGFFDITASCLVNVNDEQYLLVSSWGKISSINIKTGGFTKFNGDDVGENAPGFNLNISKENWVKHGNICRLEQFNKTVYAFYDTGYVYKCDVSSPKVWTKISTNEYTNDYGKAGVTRVTARYGDVVFSASNIGSSNQKIECFDLNSNATKIELEHIESAISNLLAVKDNIYFYGSTRDGNRIIRFNVLTNKFSYVASPSSIGNSGNLCYDGNDRIYLVNGGTVSYYSLSTGAFVVLHSTNDFGGTDVPEYIVVNGKEYIAITDHRFDINLKVWETYSFTAKETSISTSTKSIIYNHVRYDLGSDSPSAKDTRDDDVPVRRDFNKDFEFEDSRYITAIGFACHGRVLVISYSDGGIGSIDIPFNKYTSPEYFQAYKVKHSEPKNINSEIKTLSLTSKVSSEYDPHVLPYTVSVHKKEVASSKIEMDTITYPSDSFESLLDKYVEINGIPTYENPNYTFSHWSLVENGELDSDGNGMTEEERTRPALSGETYSFYAVFYDTVASLAEVMENVIGSNVAENLKRGTDFNKPEYTFVKWCDENGNDLSDEEWNDRKYNNGDSVSVWILIGNTYTLLKDMIPENPPEYEGKDDFNFSHWSLEEDGDKITSEELSETNKYIPGTEYTLYAVYKDKTESLVNLINSLEIPELEGYTFAYWSLEEDGEAIDLSTLEGNIENTSDGMTIYAIYFDTIEPYLNRSVIRVFAKPGEYLSEGATSIENVGNDVLFHTSNKTIRWAEDIGVFFSGKDERYTGVKAETDSGEIKCNTPITPMPICDAGVCSIGKYIIYINGYNKFAELPTLTAHNGVIVYDTEYDEYAVMYTGESSLRGTKRAKIKSFCYAYDHYIYEFGGLERVDEHVGTDNFSIFRRTGKIEEIDLITGKIRELSNQYGHKQDVTGLNIIGKDSDGNDVTDDIYTKVGSNEIRYLTKVGNELVGWVSMGKEEENTVVDINGKTNVYCGIFKFNLDTKKITWTPDSSRKDIIFGYYSEDGSTRFDFTEEKDKFVIIPTRGSLRYNFAKSGEYKYDLLAVVNGAIETYCGNTLYSRESMGKYKFDPSVLNIGNDNYKYSFRIPQTLPDGSLFIECEPLHNTNSNKEDNIVYRHLILKDTDKKIVDGIDSIQIHTEPVCSFETIDGDLYAINATDNNISVTVVEKEYGSSHTTSLDKKFKDVSSLVSVVCSSVIGIFVKDSEGTHIFTYEYSLRDLKERTSSKSIKPLNGVIRFDYYYNSVVYVNEECVVEIIHGMTNESHNRNEALVVETVCDEPTPSIEDYEVSFEKNRMFFTFIVDDSTMVRTINCSDSGIKESCCDIIFNEKINLADFHNVNGEIVWYDVSGGRVTKYSRPLPKYKLCGDFNTYTLGNGNKYQYVTNDGKNVFVTTERFNEVYKISIETGNMQKYTIVNSSVDSEVRDIAALNGVLYALSASGSIFEFDTNKDTLNEFKGFVSETSEDTSVKMCSDIKDEYIFIVKNGRIYRYNAAKNLIKLYDGITFEGNIVNVRYIEDIDELRIISVVKSMSGSDDENTTTNLSVYAYSFNFTEGTLRTIGSYNATASSHDGVQNVNKETYIQPIHFDDNGNTYIFNDAGGIIVIDNNNMKSITASTTNNDSNNVLMDVSISKDDVYLVTKQSKDDELMHIVKASKPCNYIKSSRRSFVNGNALCSNRVFVWNGETYLYGSSDNPHTILKFDESSLKLIPYSNGAITDATTEFEDRNVIGLNVFIGGIVYIVGMSSTESDNLVKVTVIGYDLKSKSVNSSASAIVTVDGVRANDFEVVASGQGNWSSHYFTTVLKSLNSQKCTSITIDMYNQEDPLGTSIVKIKNYECDSNAVSYGGAIANMNGKVITVGGNSIDSINPFNKIGSEFSLMHNINDEFYETIDDSSLGSPSTIIKSGPNLKVIGNGKAINVGQTGLTPFDIARFEDEEVPFTIYSAIDLKSNNGKSNFVIPCGDNSVIINNNNVYTIDNEKPSMASNSGVYQFSPSPVTVFEKDEYTIHVYSGVTKDTFVSVDSSTKEIIHKVDVERDYGTYIKSIEKIDETRFIIIYSGSPNVGTLVVHPNGFVSIKRYDGSIFGKTIDTGTNVHSIQEVDLTLLFDEEMSESDFRTVEGINAD